ncbi:MAG: hypothetical protein RL095_1953 [Verrucomicrobiota bacterium]|jgi:hypothetical protein
MHPAVKVLAVSLSLGTLGFLVWQAQHDKPRITKGKNNLKRTGLAIQSYYRDGSSTFMKADTSELTQAAALRPAFFSSSKSIAAADFRELGEDEWQELKLSWEKQLSSPRPAPPWLIQKNLFEELKLLDQAAKLTDQARSLFAQKRFPEALARLDEAFKIAPFSQEAADLRTRCLQAQQDPAGSKAAAPHFFSSSKIEATERPSTEPQP